MELGFDIFRGGFNMNREEALKVIDRLILNESKILFTALCHLEETGFKSVAEQLLKEANEYHELQEYIKENLK